MTRIDSEGLREGGLARNGLLASLPVRDQDLLAPHARSLAATRGQILFHPGQDVEAVFFPCEAVVSLVVATPDGRTAEAGLIGPEGALGGLVAAAPHPAFARGVVQMPGEIIVVGLRAFEEAKAASSALRDVLSRFADCFIAQLLQTVACNTRHPLEQRLARWLLTLRGIAGRDVLPLTQEYLAEMLGVQRTTVTACAARLQERGLIRYSRGRIAVADADGLAAASCRCHLRVQAHYSRLLDANAEVAWTS